MDSFFNIPFDIQTVLLVTIAILFVLLCCCLVLLARLSSRLQDMEGAQNLWHKKLMKEITLNSPIRAAIAARMASDQKSPLSLEQFQTEVAALTDKWPEIETLADKAHTRLADLVNQAEQSN